MAKKINKLDQFKEVGSQTGNKVAIMYANQEHLIERVLEGETDGLYKCSHDIERHLRDDCSLRTRCFKKKEVPHCLGKVSLLKRDIDKSFKLDKPLPAKNVIELDIYYICEEEGFVYANVL